MIACERCGVVYNRTSAQADDWMDEHCRICQYAGKRRDNHWDDANPWWVEVGDDANPWWVEVE